MIELDPETSQVAADLFDHAGTLLDHRFGPYPEEDDSIGSEQVALGSLLIVRSHNKLEVRLLDNDEVQEGSSNNFATSGVSFDKNGKLTGASILVMPTDVVEDHIEKQLRGKQLKGFLDMMLKTLTDESGAAA